MKRHTIVLGLALVFVPIMAFGQLKSEKPGQVDIASKLITGLQPQNLVGMLGLNPNRLHIRQSYSLSFMNIGGQSLGQGVYLNNIAYQVSDPLMVSVEWGFLHQPLAPAGVTSPYKNGFFLSNARVDYRPSNTFHFQVEYSAYPTSGYYSPYNRNSRNLWGSPWSDSREK